MEKVPIASGEVQATPGIKLVKRFARNLFRKRETYASYFEHGLPSVDSALRRVQAFRAWGIERKLVEAGTIVGSSGPRNDPIFAPGKWRYATVLKDKISLKECGRKEKKLLKEYATRVRDRAVGRVSLLNIKLAASQARRAERERRREVLQRDLVADRMRLMARVRVAVENPRSVLAGCSSHRLKECNECWDDRQIAVAKVAKGYTSLSFLEEIKARDALIHKTLKEWQGSPPA
jgi:hypothetical protein